VTATWCTPDIGVSSLPWIEVLYTRPRFCRRIRSITDPSFYASEERCPDGLIEHVFRVAPQAKEGLPLLPERIAIMREVGAILCAVSCSRRTVSFTCVPTIIQEFGGSFQGFIEAFQRRYNYEGTGLQLVQMVTDTFPSFRDEH